MKEVQYREADGVPQRWLIYDMLHDLDRIKDSTQRAIHLERIIRSAIRAGQAAEVAQIPTARLRIDTWGDAPPDTHISGVKATDTETGLVVAVDGLGQHRNRDLAMRTLCGALSAKAST